MAMLRRLVTPSSGDAISTTADSGLSIKANTSASHRGMAPSFGVLAPIQEPTFPEDIERTIIDVLLNDARDMCGTMSLVASRFHAWWGISLLSCN
jgi:hypothetical protein